jgi:two-component system, LuxR family, response regulator FixJ
MSSASTVFVVDDDEQVRESLAALVQSAGFDFHSFASGSEFLESYVPDGPACLVLDLRMPQMSGLEVVEALAARNLRLPVIMISGHGDIPAAVAAMKSGAIDFLEKPYRGAALLESIRRAVDLDARSRASDEKRRELLSR